MCCKSRCAAFGLVAGLAVSGVVSSWAEAALVYWPGDPGLTTPLNPAGGNSDGTGVWFNILTGYAEVRGTLFPSPLFEDGKFFLFSDGRFFGNPANIFTQGFFSRGNGVIYTSTTNLNPARFGLGAVIGPSTGFQSPGAGFSDLGPNFGNWPTPGDGFLGFTIRDPDGASASDVFYGFADITVNADYSVTLNGFGYENVRGAAVTTVRPAPPVVIKGDFGGEVDEDGGFNRPDGFFDNFDIDAFLLALSDPQAYLALNPSLTAGDVLTIGDFGGEVDKSGGFNAPDGSFDNFDIDAFLFALSDPAGYAAIQPGARPGSAGAIPEPAALGLLAPAVLALTRRRRA